jgi:hypothetical protein
MTIKMIVCIQCDTCLPFSLGRWGNAAAFFPPSSLGGKHSIRIKKHTNGERRPIYHRHFAITADPYSMEFITKDSSVQVEDKSDVVNIE